MCRKAVYDVMAEYITPCELLGLKDYMKIDNSKSEKKLNKQLIRRIGK